MTSARSRFPKPATNSFDQAAKGTVASKLSPVSNMITSSNSRVEKGLLSSVF
jgi:hypothetical protein